MTPDSNDLPAVSIGIDDIVQAAKRLDPGPIALQC